MDNPIVPAGENLPAEWGITPQKQAALKAATQSRTIKHGLYTSVPMICRESACPFKEQCVPYQLKQVSAGDRCLKEIGMITEALDSYIKEFHVDPEDPEQRVDRIQIQMLITLEILMERAQMLLAKGDFIETIDMAFSPDGQDVLQQPQLHKAVEALPKLQRRHNEILQLLMATRKNKVDMQQSTGMTIDKMLSQMILNAGAVKVRQQLMRDGKYGEAEQAGIIYGIEANERVALPVPDTIDHEH